MFARKGRNAIARSLVENGGSGGLVGEDRREIE
jgi:hypothetical protein